MSLPPLDDTIAAIATAPGRAGLAVVRVSGPRAIAIADACFRGGGALADAASHTLHHGWAVGAGAPGEGPRAGARDGRRAGARDGRRAGAHDGRRAEGTPPSIDEIVAGVFRAPRSYTGEDVVELSCHGGALPARQVLDALLAAGARLAAPGEFTMRAFLGGRIDLVQAEAVADLIQAETGAAKTLALDQLAGALSRRLAALRERLADLTAEVEARVDFAEDVGGVEVPERVVSGIREVAGAIGALLGGAAFGRALRDGVRVPILGRPNVGKSSLFNALVGEARAIVTPIAGTTRDAVTESLELGGVRVRLADTAGLRATEDAVESIGVARSLEALEESRVVVWVVDGSEPLAGEDREIASRLAGREVVVALNKRDLGHAFEPAALGDWLEADRHVVERTSAASGDGVAALGRRIAERFDPGGAGAPPATGNPRHAEALDRAHAALERAGRAGEAGAPGEIVALELHEARAALAEVTGEGASDDLLERIFSRFCIGK